MSLLQLANDASASVLMRSDNAAAQLILDSWKRCCAAAFPTGRLALTLSQNERQLQRSQASCKEE
ncbi:MAG: hypothetical protein ACXWOX_22820 [Ktedonobacteraceae bacterium]